MLESTMTEGQADSSGIRSIKIDEPCDVVNICFELIYTGSLPFRSAPVTDLDSQVEGTGELPVATVLQVFRLCHRWQLLPFADLLEKYLASKVNEQNIDDLL